MKLFVIGFPKTGTSTVHHALKASGYRPIHQREGKICVGERLSLNFQESRSLFEGFADYDAITQADRCHPKHDRNYWPQLNLELLRRVNVEHPDCLLILTIRNVDEHVASICNWGDLQNRLTISDIPGLPRGKGATPQQLKDWINWHYKRLKKSDIIYSQVTIDAPDARAQLEAALGFKVKWWGVKNQTRPQKER